MDALTDEEVERVRDLLLARSRDTWKNWNTPPKGCIGQIAFWEKRHPKPMRILEADESDWEQAQTAGDVLREWWLDAKGLQQVEPCKDRDPSENNVIDGRYRVSLISFHIDRDNRRIVWNEIFGPLAASGNGEEIQFTNGKIELTLGKTRLWMS